MSFQPGTRVRMRNPSWNPAIWGFSGTVGPSTRYTERYQIILDQPNPRNTRDSATERHFVYAAHDEIEPLIEGKTSHTGWSPA